MAIRFVTGIPGSGKSYWAVDHIVKTYFTYRKEDDEYIPKKNEDSQKTYTIITNIDSLLLPHIDLEKAIEASELSIDQFFTKNYQDKIHNKYSHIVYVIDEAQRFFPRKNRISNDTWFYFEWHRHYGDDIYILTQHTRLVAENISLHMEYEMRATKRLFALAGELRYLKKSDNQIIDRKIIKPSKRVFALYKSMEAKESEQIKNPFRRYALALIVFLFFACWMFKHFFIRDGSVQMIRNSQSTNTVYAAEGFTEPSFQPSQKEKTHDIEERIKVQVSYIQVGKRFFVYDPQQKKLIPSNQRH